MSRVLPVKNTIRHSIWIKSEKHAKLRVFAFILGDWLSLGHLWKSASKMGSLSKLHSDPLLLGDKNMKRVGRTSGKGALRLGPQGEAVQLRGPLE